MEAMAKTIRALTVHGRRIGVLAAPGDRRDEDIRALARAAAPAFDLLLLREDHNRRGRGPGEVGELLREGFVAAGFPAERIAPGVFEEEEAVQRGLETAQAGDLLVIFGDDLQRDWEQIVSFGKPAAAGGGGNGGAPEAGGMPEAGGAPAAAPVPVFSPAMPVWSEPRAVPPSAGADRADRAQAGEED